MSNQAQYGWLEQTRDDWREAAVFLLEIPIAAPESGSVLGQLQHEEAVPGLVPAASFLGNQAGHFLSAALDLQIDPYGLGVLGPLAPLARSALLCASKLISVFAPLCLEVRQLGPAAQLTHDVLLEGYLEQERRCRMVPDHPSVAAWTQHGRMSQLERINSLRVILSKQTLLENHVRPNHILVKDGVWIWDAQRKSASVRKLRGAQYDAFEARMEWAWFRGSTVTHGAPSFRADPDGMSYVYLDVADASVLLKCAVEMVVSAATVADGVVRAAAAPDSFDRNLGGALPNRRPR